MRTKLSEIKWHLMLTAIALILIIPIIFAISNSFKTLSDAYSNILNIIPSNPTLNNYLQVFSQLPFWRITLNTFLISAAVTVFKTVTSFLAAYAFVYFVFKGKNIIYFILISTIFIPFTVTMIPNYLTISSLGLSDSLLGVILPQLSDAIGIFLLRQSMRSIPRSLVEAVYLENVSHIRIMKDIILPLARPAVISTGIIFFINSWNEYVWPVLILKSQDHYTLSLALQTYVSQESGTEFTVVMAVSVMAMLPPLILYFIFQKYIIDTFTLSGLKG